MSGRLPDDLVAWRDEVRRFVERELQPLGIACGDLELAAAPRIALISPRNAPAA